VYAGQEGNGKSIQSVEFQQTLATTKKKVDRHVTIHLPGQLAG